ncbi:MAG: transglycosylase domain-containing protein [Actinomycetota bacterium]
MNGRAGRPPRRATGGGRDGNGNGSNGGGRGNRRYAARREPNGRWWRRLLTWKMLGFGALGTFLLGMIGVAVAYAMTPVPEGNPFAETQASIVYWSDGETELGRFSEENREIVGIDEIPTHVRQAVIAAEDRSFYDNSGFDPIGIARAARDYVLGGEIRSGGSTITQQYVKNYYLTQEQTWTRKVKELFISVKVDQRLSKEQILEDYLNTIWFGRGTLYGVQTASESYFGKPVTDLSVEEGAALAALIRNPRVYDPTVSEENAARFEERFRFVLNGMVEVGAIDAATAESAEVPEVKPKSEDNQYAGSNGYLIDQVKRELLDAGIEEQRVHSGGLRIVTTFDREAQQAAVTAVEENRPTDNAKNVHVGLAAVVPGDGAVTAIYGGPDFVEQSFNNAMQAKPSVGSTIKPLTLAMGLTQGISLDSRFAGNSGFEHEDLGDKKINNYKDSDYGEYVDLIEATERSINTAYVDLATTIAESTGYQAIEELMIRAGIPEGTPDLASQTGAITLGIAPVAPVDLATAYATIAAGGERYDWYTVKSVTARSGEIVYEPERESERAFDSDVAADVTYAMRQVVEGDQGTAVKWPPQIGRPSAGKTGTHEDLSAWYGGFTPQLSTTVAIFKTDYSAGTPSMKSLDGVAGMDSFTGGEYPSRIWTAFMKEVLEGEPVIDFPPRSDVGEPMNTPTPTPTCPEDAETPPPEDESDGRDWPDCETASPEPEPTPTLTCPPGWTGEPPDCKRPEPEEIKVPDVGGMTEDEAVGRLEDEGFQNIQVQYLAVCSGAGTVLSQQPEPGEKAVADEPIVITVGEQDDCERVPKVTGETVDAAIDILADAGFEAQQETAQQGGQPGTVAKQDPSADELAPTSEPVTIYVVPDDEEGSTATP